MRFVFDSPLCAQENMQKDIFHYQLAENFDDKDFILRIYQWQNPSISLGISQKENVLKKNIDKKKISDKIEVVKRITGGRAVLHHNEITYSIAARIDNIYFGGGLHESYRKISKVLIAFLEQLGVKAILQKQKLKKSSSACCYDASSFYEVEVKYQNLNQKKITEKKLIGSAQKRGHKAFLQHGSIPYQKTDYVLENYLQQQYQPQEKTEKIFLENLISKKYSLNEIVLLLRDYFFRAI